MITVVTGANSGIGRATAIHLAAHGHDVFGTVRDPARATKLRAMADAAGVEVNLVELDVGDDESVRRGINEVLDTAGRIDVLVNNAGVGPTGAVEETSTSRMLDTLNVNLCGALRCLHHALPGMRERRSGCVVNVTSIAGRVAPVAQAPYVASKWAFEGLSEQLALELAPFGVRVAIVEPGVTKSAIFAKNVDNPNATGAYDDHYSRMLEFYAATVPRATDPFEVAAVILHAITTDEPRLRYPCALGGPETAEGRRRMTDEEWVTLGTTIPDESEYHARYLDAFGVDLTPPPG